MKRLPLSTIPPVDYEELGVVVTRISHRIGWSEIACKEGCDYCCHLRVDATLSEAISCLNYLEATQTLLDYQATKQRIERTAEQLSKMSNAERADSKLPCPLLVDRRCSVYPVRPIKCRGYTSRKVEDCREDFEQPGHQGQVLADAVLFSAMEQASVVVRNTLRSAGVDPTIRDLVAQLGRLLDPNSAATSDGVGGLPSQRKVGRNERCPCGSGQKFKRCHGKR